MASPFPSATHLLRPSIRSFLLFLLSLHLFLGVPDIRYDPTNLYGLLLLHPVSPLGLYQKDCSRSPPSPYLPAWFLLLPCFSPHQTCWLCPFRRDLSRPQCKVSFRLWLNPPPPPPLSIRSLSSADYESCELFCDTLFRFCWSPSIRGTPGLCIPILRFRSLPFPRGHPMTDTYRPLCGLPPPCFPLLSPFAFPFFFVL